MIASAFLARANTSVSSCCCSSVTPFFGSGAATSNPLLFRRAPPTRRRRRSVGGPVAMDKPGAPTLRLFDGESPPVPRRELQRRESTPPCVGAAPSLSTARHVSDVTIGRTRSPGKGALRQSVRLSHTLFP